MEEDTLCNTCEMSFDEKMAQIRANIKDMAQDLNKTKDSKSKSEVDGTENIGEIMANLTLAYRHLEDASMRIGKVLQHRNGGVSIYDKNVVGSPE